MPAGAESQVVATELERVEPKIPILFEREDKFYSHVEKVPVEIISSRDMRIPLELRPGGKSGHFDPDGGDLGRGDMPLYDKGTINTVHLKHGLEWTTKRKWSTDSSRKAVVNAFRRDLASGMKQFRRFVETLCMGAGNGVLGTITTVTPAAGTDTYLCTTDGFGVKLMYYGQDISIYSSNLGTCRNTAAATTEQAINFYDLANKTVKAPSVAGVINGDVIVASGLMPNTPPVSIFGVPYHNSNASTGSWLGFDRSTTPEIRANRVAANNNTLTLPMPRLALNKIGDRIGEDQMTKMEAWMHPAQAQSYEELGFEAIVINKQAKEEGLDLYFNENMRMAGAPVKKSYMWDRTRIDFNDMNNWGRAEYNPAGWYKDDNGNRYFVVRGTSGGVATSNLAYLCCSFNLFMRNPAGGAYIDTLTVPSGY